MWCDLPSSFSFRCKYTYKKTFYFLVQLSALDVLIILLSYFKIHERWFYSACVFVFIHLQTLIYRAGCLPATCWPNVVQHSLAECCTSSSFLLQAQSNTIQAQSIKHQGPECDFSWRTSPRSHTIECWKTAYRTTSQSICHSDAKMFQTLFTSVSLSSRYISLTPSFKMLWCHQWCIDIEVDWFTEEANNNMRRYTSISFQDLFCSDG